MICFSSPIAEKFVEDKVRVKMPKAGLITKVYSKDIDKMVVLSSVIKKKFNLSETTKNFSTHELRRMIGLMPINSKMEKI